MMDLSTTYLGFRLPHPLIPGASPLASDFDTIRRLEDAGAAAIVLPSLFEEQISADALGTEHHMLAHEGSHAEAESYFPLAEEFAMGPDRYLEHVRRVSNAVQVPVIGSLNGTSPEGWLDYARLIQDAGADALELNFYHVATDPKQDGAALEQRLLDVVRAVKTHVRIPVAIKLSPFYSSFANVAHQLDEAGANGLVLFNRFYQPDIDPDALDAVPRLQLSDSGDLLLRLRWLAILSGRVRASLAATGGVHTCIDAVKAVMAGAHAVQMVAALLLHGPSHLAKIRRELSHWLEVREYESLEQAQGSMSLLRCPNPEAFERGNYMKILQTWRAR
ncbi:MAG TPA: dihydroorotate dehydrogenase-like protein [Vicinamibacterales bacterium]|jgi:dihydroorotate dehydrogenase (fumarate)|nr:dihydroorotate dehydrogenase-like protein [Vicinamibacterales bacterium]